MGPTPGHPISQPGGLICYAEKDAEWLDGRLQSGESRLSRPMSSGFLSHCTISANMSRTLFYLPLLAFLVPPASGADAPSYPEQSSTINVKSVSLEGQWDPGSRAYEGYPGKFKIRANSVMFGICRQPFTVLRDEIREDGEWNGIDNNREKRRYRDISIRIHPNPKCESIRDQVFRFLLPQHIPCYASLMLYSSEIDLGSKRFNGWGGYYNKSCMQDAP